jgi:hypothetical protein
MYNNMSGIINNNNIYKKSALSRSKAIDQYDLNNNFIKSWLSASETGSELGIQFKCISACCVNSLKTYNKFI